MQDEPLDRFPSVHPPGMKESGCPAQRRVVWRDGPSTRRPVVLAVAIHVGLLVALAIGIGAAIALAGPTTARAAGRGAAAGGRGDAASAPSGAAPAEVGADGSAARKAAADAAFSAQREANRAARAAQQEVEDLDDEAQALLARYRSVVTETASYDAYSAQLAQSIASQETELSGIQAQMGRAGDTARDVLPLTSRLIDDLEAFIALDAPFHVEERRERISGLRSLMGRADVSLSEKYRRVIEAYLIELEFGRTMETYEGVLESTGDPLTVDYLRIGRVALLYQTADGGRTGYWDGDAKRWVEDVAYAQAFRKGARIASKQDAPDLVIAPISAPKEM